MFCCCSKLVKQPKAHCYDIEYFPWYFLVYKVWQCCLSTMFAEIARSSFCIASSRVIGRHLVRPIFATSARTVATVNYSQIKLKTISTPKPDMYSTVEKGNKNSPTYSLYFSKYKKKAATVASLSFKLIKLTCNRYKQLCNKLRPIKRRLLYQQY